MTILKTLMSRYQPYDNGVCEFDGSLKFLTLKNVDFGFLSSKGLLQVFTGLLIRHFGVLALCSLVVFSLTFCGLDNTFIFNRWDI